MSGRAPFTSDEDKLLVKYIATYSSSVVGRSGNRLYRTLCEDAENKWKWSRTHPWQSWRDRYCKNQQEFNIKIKKYQIKYDLFPANKNLAEENSEEKQVSQSKRKRENEKEKKRAKAKLESVEHKLIRIQKSSQVTASVLDDRGKGDAVTSDAEHDPTFEDKITQEKGATPNVAPIDVVDQKVANSKEPCLPARTTPRSSPSLHADVTGRLSPTTTSNSSIVNQKSSIIERPYQTSRRTVLTDSQPVASSSKVQLSPPQSNAPTRVQAPPNPHRRKPIVKDDIFFESSSPTPSRLSPSNATRAKHRNPKLVEGPFGTRFADRRKSGGGGNDSSEDEKDTQTCPPSRKRNNSEDKGTVVETKTTDTITSTLPRDTENVPDVVLHAVGEHQPRKASSSYMNGLDHGQEEADNLSTHQGRIKHPVRRESFHAVKGTPDQPRLLQVSSGLSYDTFNPAPAANAESSALGRGRETMKPPLPRNSWTPNDPFRSTNSEGIVRRHSMGNLREVQDSAVRRLDLRAEMVKRRFAASSPFTYSRGQSVTSTMSYQPSPKSSHAGANPPMNTDNIQRRRSSIPIADEDREHIEFLGLNTAIEGIARESGFLVEQVWQVYDHYGSIKRTQKWIRLYRKNSAMLQELTHEQMLKDEMGAIADERLTPRSSPLERSQKREPSTEATMSTRPSPPKTQENRLKIKPLPPGSQRSPSEYSPPFETRAGEYNRLVGQGRVKEAMSREHRRASGSSGVFPRLKSSPAIWGTPQQGSPSHGAETLERDGDGIEDGNNAVDQLLDGSKNEAGLQEGEELLFLSAHAGMVDRLRAIEQNMNPDYMLRWVAARLGEMEDEFRSPSSPS
ncbi:hypothetical protein C0995_004798 [Termitomyces sp. Mi166|nr:hypothetical protein C0995_004798 [Termitomyces sp. Mi166\